MRRPAVGLALFALLLPAAAGPARGEEVVADLSSHTIAIGSGFTGASVVLFGATHGAGDVIAIVRGPPHDVTVWKKAKVAGIWVNAESATFLHVPSFYAVAASRPVAELLPGGARARYQIGLAHLELTAAPPAAPEAARRFAAALIDDQERAGLFARRAAKIGFLGHRLFRATLGFPADVPTGIYSVQILLVSDGAVIGEHTTSLEVFTTGTNAALSDFANQNAAAYGVVAVVTALVAGWLASLPFRGG
jgi:uncharacterized protein (TIGR02186 family)